MVHMATKKLPKAVGRPRGGLAPGEKVRAYLRVTVRFPPETKARLLAWSVVTKRPAWLLLTDAIDAGVRALPAGDRELVEKLARRTTKSE